MLRRNGLNYLIPTWKLFSEKYADTEEEIYEWLNDLDTRRIIDEVLSAFSENERIEITQELKPIDDNVLAKTFEVNECVWGDKIEKECKYNRQSH